MMTNDNVLSLSAQTAQPLIICFSQLRWNFVFQRPQHLMTKASSTNRVIFWEEPVFADVLSPHLDWQPQSDKIGVAVPVMRHGMSPAEIDAAHRTLLDDLIATARPSRLIAWYGTPMMLTFSDHLEADLVVYDNMDELSAFLFAPHQLKELEQKLLDRADVVFTGGMSIYEAKQHRHHNIHPMPSSIDHAHFSQTRDWRGGEPADQAGIARPRIGWFGVIDERMNPALLAELAALRPEWQFVMVGPVVKIDPATLPHGENIHWLGMKNYKELPAYLAGWDAGFIPYALNESTQFISPTKTPEFLAAGLPLVATAVRDIVRPYGDAGLCEIVATAEEMANALERAMARKGPAFNAEVDAFLAGKSWDRTWAQMDALLQAASRARTALKETA